MDMYQKMEAGELLVRLLDPKVKTFKLSDAQRLIELVPYGGVPYDIFQAKQIKKKDKTFFNFDLAVPGFGNLNTSLAEESKLDEDKVIRIGRYSIWHEPGYMYIDPAFYFTINEEFAYVLLIYDAKKSEYTSKKRQMRLCGSVRRAFSLLWLGIDQVIYYEGLVRIWKNYEEDQFIKKI
ncbi:hypothetical protein ISS03_00155 [Patescibacteria group bacterium]|nr:hypothetical protein [Patescibacteria group bacterium]